MSMAMYELGQRWTLLRYPAVGNTVRDVGAIAHAVGIFWKNSGVRSTEDIKVILKNRIVSIFSASASVCVGARASASASVRGRVTDRGRLAIFLQKGTSFLSVPGRVPGVIGGASATVSLQGAGLGLGIFVAITRVSLRLRCKYPHPRPDPCNCFQPHSYPQESLTLSHSS